MIGLPATITAADRFFLEKNLKGYSKGQENQRFSGSQKFSIFMKQSLPRLRVFFWIAFSSRGGNNNDVG
jgi:hypothetical protein